MNLILDVFSALPLFAATILQSGQFDPSVLRNLFNLSVLLFTWATLRRTIPWFLKREGAVVVRTAALLLASFAVVAALEMTRLRLANDLIGLTLFTLGSFALEQALRQRNQPWWGCLAFFVASTSLAVLGFQVIGESLRWQPLLFACAIGLSSTCTEIARRFDLLKPQAYAAKAYAAVFLVSPTLIALLAYTRQLPVHFLASYAILLAAPMTVTPLLAGANPAPTRALFVFPVFIVILVLLRLTFGV